MCLQSLMNESWYKLEARCDLCPFEFVLHRVPQIKVYDDTKTVTGEGVVGENGCDSVAGDADDHDRHDRRMCCICRRDDDWGDNAELARKLARKKYPGFSLLPGHEPR